METIYKYGIACYKKEMQSIKRVETLLLTLFSVMIELFYVASITNIN